MSSVITPPGDCHARLDRLDRPAASLPGLPVRLSSRAWIVLAAALGLLVVFTTDQVVPASSAYQADMRLWLAGRATGIVSYLLLTALVVLGLILSHPTNQSTWRLSRLLFPWHENLFVFVGAFLAAHVVSLVLDPYAGVGVQGALLPGLSEYRSAPVALGTLGLYAALVAGVTARWTRLLPPGLWLRLHRLAAVAWILGWVHGLTAGTDALPLAGLYVATGLAVVGAGAYRYWVAKKARPTFATSLPPAGAPHAVTASTSRPPSRPTSSPAEEPAR